MNSPGTEAWIRLSDIVRPSRLWSLLLLPGGLAAGHLIGYAVVRAQGGVPSLNTGHGYLHTLGMLAVPFTAAALLRIGVSGARGERLPVSFTRLAVQQVLAYMAVELVEHAAAGISPSVSLRESTMIWGIAAQVAVAAAVSLVVRGVSRAGRRLVLRGRVGWLSIISAPARHDQPAAGAVTPSVALSSLSRRGPPLACS